MLVTNNNNFDYQRRMENYRLFVMKVCNITGRVRFLKFYILYTYWPTQPELEHESLEVNLERLDWGYLSCIYGVKTFKLVT